MPAARIEGAALRAYWGTVHRNPQARRIRLVLVADEIPRAMQRVIEFLNEELRTTEVIGIEIKRYHDAVHDLSTLGFDQLKRVAPFDEEAKRVEVAARLEAIAGVNLRNLVSGSPDLSTKRLLDETELALFLDTVDWIGVQVGLSDT